MATLDGLVLPHNGGGGSPEPTGMEPAVRWVFDDGHDPVVGRFID
jgi:hypothetical protein